MLNNRKKLENELASNTRLGEQVDQGHIQGNEAKRLDGVRQCAGIRAAPILSGEDHRDQPQKREDDVE